MICHEDIFTPIVHWSSATPDAAALLMHGADAVTYAELVRRLDAVAQRIGAHPLGESGVVAIVLPGGGLMAIACLATMSCAIAAPMNPDMKYPEYLTALKATGTRLLLAHAAPHPVRDAARDLGIAIADFDASWFQTPSAGRRLDGLRIPPGDRTTLLLQTSGTTSSPKIVPLTHRNIAASAANLAASLALQPADRCLHFLPFFHVGGLVDVLAAPLITGGSTICMPGFTAPEFFSSLGRDKPSWTQAAPTMIHELVDHAKQNPGVSGSHNLRLLRSVSASLPVDLMERCEALLGVPVIEIYGMTETAGVITSNPCPPGRRMPGSVGIAAGASVEILGETGDVLPPGEVGEVVVSGPSVMAGYLGEPALGLGSHGYRLPTGDLGVLDTDGYLYLRGRRKEMINRGGEKVSPFEVDAVLASHPDVRDAAIFALPHPTLGEEVAAAVVLHSGCMSDEAELRSYLSQRLAFFKVPAAIVFVDALERTRGGKLQRHLLAAQHADGILARTSQRPTHVAPSNLLARQLTDLWEEILQCKPVGMADNFFSLGGNSLKAARFINALQDSLGEIIYVSSLFDAPTPALYEAFLRHSHPAAVARLLGQSLAPQQASLPMVDAQMIADFERRIVRAGKVVPDGSGPNPSAIFVLSAPRSGSTLLRAMLAGHPDLFSPPELYLLSYLTLSERREAFPPAHRSQLEGNLRAVMELRGEGSEICAELISGLEDKHMPTKDYYRLLQRWMGDRTLVDKTPAYASDPAVLRRAEDWFGEPFYIHLVRHPYGMIRSFEEARLGQLWFPRLVGFTGERLEDQTFAPRHLAEMVWFILNRNIRTFLATIPRQRQLTISYEALVSAPEDTMRRLCDAMGRLFEPAMITPYEAKERRMLDGVHAVSRMIGDPKFHQHKAVDGAAADQWKTAWEVDFLGAEATGLAQELGFHETIATALDREEFAF